MTTEESYRSLGLKNGLIAGLGCIMVSLVLYIINMELVLGFWLWLGYVVIVGMMVYTAITVKNANNGVLEFRDGVKAVFPVTAVAVFIWIAFNALLFIVIDPELIALSKEKAVEMSIWVLEKSGADEDTIASAVAEAEAQDYSPSFKNSAINYAQSCIVGFIYSLVIAGFFHLTSKNNQEIQSHE